MACIDPDGYVTLVGRNKDLILCGGLNVYPKEVESEIDTLPGVVESAVIGIPHPDLGETPIAVVVRNPETALDEQSVTTQLAGRLARYKQPRKVVFAPALPRNIMGKVQKKLLRDEYRHLSEQL